MLAPLAAEQNDKQLAVLTAARKVFLEHGFSAATTDMIQRAAGVSKATMYACFPNKEALFVAVIEHLCASMTSTFKAMRPSPGSITKTLTDLGMSCLDIVLSPDALALNRVIMAEAPRFPELGRRFYLAGPKVVIAMIAEQLREAVEIGEINVQSIGMEAAATLFLSMIRAQAQMECLTHPGTRPSAAQKDYWVQIAVTTFLAAFGVATAAPVSAKD
ncbi:TetR/AcrR family transcriptional regulator [Pseudothauera nasutitermitis]|uniref:TetR/AcrR family transcriptional regulator n=1 Tax=Pseudothauera nasutitermitis TaxID=2565930 RepID=A0A4S4B3G8_9RHOO|nr:TetR/AcrR family transcriptional regulator [Pseudothauera nasutitermitis]THF67210.1 TetR/AcrR family transcriptional regulator [Pseudothauera nasutitermitis]